MNVATITAEFLLQIPESEPERLFSGPDQVAMEFKAAAKRLHPDMPQGDKSAFQHLNALHKIAEQKIKLGEWHIPGLLVLKTDDGEKRIRFLKEFDAGVGRGYIGKTLVTYILPPDLHDLAENAKKVIKGFETAKYPNDDVKKDIEYRRPRLKKFFKTLDGKSVLLIEKPEDMIRLRDVLDNFKGNFDPKHVAWIMSELHNLACWLEYSKLTNNDISLDSVFISPPKHSAMILGGWWFAVPEGNRMQRVQVSRTVANAPRSVIESKLASIKTDLALIRMLGRELLGETGMSFTKDVPSAMADWFKHASTGDARKDYKLWSDVPVKAFGKRKFTRLEITSTDIYKE